ASMAAVAWWVGAGLISLGEEVVFVAAFGTSLLTGAGLVLASRSHEASAKFGLTLSTYAAFVFAISVSLIMADFIGRWGSLAVAPWLAVSGGLGVVLAAAAAVISRRWGPGFAA